MWVLFEIRTLRYLPSSELESVLWKSPRLRHWAQTLANVRTSSRYLCRALCATCGVRIATSRICRGCWQDQAVSCTSSPGSRNSCIVQSKINVDITHTLYICVYSPIKTLFMNRPFSRRLMLHRLTSQLPLVIWVSWLTMYRLSNPCVLVS